MDTHEKYCVIYQLFLKYRRLRVGLGLMKDLYNQDPWVESLYMLSGSTFVSCCMEKQWEEMLTQDHGEVNPPQVVNNWNVEDSRES